MLSQPSLRSRPRWPATLTTLLATVVVAAPAAGQEPTSTDSLRARLDSLMARVDSLESALDRAREEGERQDAEGELEALRAAAEAAAGQAAPASDPDEQDAEFVGRQRSLQALNPEISVNADIFGFSNLDDPDQDNFVPREFEFSFQSALDPYARAKIFLAHHTPGGELLPFEDEAGHGHEEEEGGFELEEAYVEWVSLPGGVSLKVGRFFQQLGQLNRWHSHALAFQTRSLPHLAFVGEEALTQAGASVRSLIPLGSSGTYEAVLEVTRSENGSLFGESNQPSFLGHFNAFWQLSEAWDLDLGLSAMGGPFREEHDEPTDPVPVPPEEELSYDQRLYNAEASLTWTPPGRSLYRGANLRAGVMARAPSGADELDGAWGSWVWGEIRVGRQWLIGGRWERVQNPSDPDETAWLVAPTLTWWQSEWVRLRTELDHIEDPTGARNLFLIQITFAMGPHKHETY